MANRYLYGPVYTDSVGSATLATAKGAGFPSTQDADDALFVFKADIDLSYGFRDYANASAAVFSGSYLNVPVSAFTDSDVIFLAEFPQWFAVKAAYLVFNGPAVGAGGTSPTLSVDLAGAITKNLIPATSLTSALGTIISNTGTDLKGGTDTTALRLPIVSSGASNPTYLTATLGGTMSTMTTKPKVRVVVEAIRL